MQALGLPCDLIQPLLEYFDVLKHVLAFLVECLALLALALVFGKRMIFLILELKVQIALPLELALFQHELAIDGAPLLLEFGDFRLPGSEVLVFGFQALV